MLSAKSTCLALNMNCVDDVFYCYKMAKIQSKHEYIYWL